LVAVIGFLAIGVTFWIAWCADRRAAKENRNSKFTNVRKLIIVLIITILIGLLLPSGPQRYRTTDEEVRVR
jgi:heme/copper-type cytochrome/quinol oxidase subunit 2